MSARAYKRSRRYWLALAAITAAGLDAEACAAIVKAKPAPAHAKPGAHAMPAKTKPRAPAGKTLVHTLAAKAKPQKVIAKNKTQARVATKALHQHLAAQHAVKHPLQHATPTLAKAAVTAPARTEPQAMLIPPIYAQPQAMQASPYAGGMMKVGLPMMLAQAATDMPMAKPQVATVEVQRYVVQVIAESVPVYESANLSSSVVAQLEQGNQIESEEKNGDWYRIRRSDGSMGWVQNAMVDGIAVLAVRSLAASERFAYPQPAPEDELQRQRPQGVVIEPRLPVIDSSQVEPPSPMLANESLPVPDRWRILKSLGLLPYNPYDPYNPNVLKGDLPVLQKVLGDEWFFNMTAVSDTLFEARKLPTPIGAQSTLVGGSNGTLGNGRQFTFAQTAIINLALIKGDTTFKPPEYEFRFVPVFNFNRTVTHEVHATTIDPSAGPVRTDQFAGVQELFIDKHLRNVSEHYDFDSLRIGIQPFTADFRGFLFLDQPFGVRLFGNRESNRYQYNLAWFRRLEKDTNSGLNDINRRFRADDTYVANVYRQDTFVPGFTLQGIVLHNRNNEGSRPDFYNENGFLERPAVFGSGRPHNYHVTYLGTNGDGHFGRWNLSASAYYATGVNELGSFSGQRETISAYFGAAELSHDFDWVRVRLNGLWASGDKDPYDSKAGGFDAVLENPQFAGADTSYWIRQAIPLIGGGGVGLTIRNGILPSLRSSGEFGQSNFINPGLHLLGVGADFDVSPRVRLISNVSYLEFDNLSSLAVLRNQQLHSTRIGMDVSVGLQYRPHFTQNVVINASVAALLPGSGLKELYGNAVDSTQYSALLNVALTF